MDGNSAGNVGTGGAPFGGYTLRSGAADPLFSDREIASYLGIGRSTVWRWVGDGVLPQPIRLGGLSRWRQSTIEAVIAKAKAEAA